MIFKFTKRQWILLIIYDIGYFVCGSCLSVQAPFYPREADSKGVTPSQYGFVFGVYCLTIFIVSPLCVKLILQVGAIPTSYMGLFIAGVTTILFGLIDKIYNVDIFFVFSLVIRILEGVGTTAFKTAGFSIIANEFSDNVATAFGSLESCFGTGVVVGPTVGGALYQWKGYSVPFFTIGVALLAVAFFSAIILSSIKEISNYERSQKGYLLLLRQPEVLLGMAAAFGAYSNISFIQTTLEPHIRRFQLRPVEVGAIYIVNGLTHSFVSPVWGIICDKWLSPQFVWSFGAIIVSISFLLLGPAPYIPLQLSVLLCICALIFHALGKSAEMVGSFYCFSKIAIKLGFPEDVNTYGISSAIYNSSCALGGFIAPSLGGFLFDKIGFPWAAHVFICFHLLLAIITILYSFLYPQNIFPKQRKENLMQSEEMPIFENGKIRRLT